jgi:hypothetical protein
MLSTAERQGDRRPALDLGAIGTTINEIVVANRYVD